MRVSIPHGGFFVGKYYTEFREDVGKEGLNPPRGIFCWEVVKEKSLTSVRINVSIPHGGFFVGKMGGTGHNRQERWSVSIPHGGFFVGKTVSEVRGTWHCLSQSPTGDFLLGRPSQCYQCRLRRWILVSIPHGGFFVGKVKGLPLIEGYHRLNPPRGIFCWEAKPKTGWTNWKRVSIPHGGFFVGKRQVVAG